jgi:hypothetical protein
MCKKRVDLSEHTSARNESYAEQLVEIDYWFQTDRLVRIEVKGLIPAAFPIVLDGLKAKFGEPSMTDSSVQNGMGNRFQNTTAVWQDGDGELVLTRFGDDLDSSSLTLTDRNYLAEKVKSARRSVADDM